MATGTQSTIRAQHTPPLLPEAEKTLIRRELAGILESRHFRGSNRSKQFLSYVVQEKLEGREDCLKERIIGAELFHRPSGYATGDDPVVRVQAGEVRRRLEQYYHGACGTPQIRIDLPVGTYVPEFQPASAAPTAETILGSLAPSTPGTSGISNSIHELSAPTAHLPAHSSSRRPRSLLLLAIALCVLIAAAIVIVLSVRPGMSRVSELDEFWAPIFATPQAVLICLEKPVVYRPRPEVYQKYAESHSNAFQSELQRNTQDLPLSPKQKMLWGDMIATPSFGVAIGDVHVVASLSGLFARLTKPSQVRIGDSFSFEDLRNSPTVLVGAFNNRWTLQMTSNLHFVFEEHGGVTRIVEEGSGGRAWTFRRDSDGKIVEDFAVVTRVLNSKTGQLMVAVAGVGDYGTRAAGDLISNGNLLEAALKTAPPDWKKRNIQILLQTNVTDFVPGPPHVIATYFW